MEKVVILTNLSIKNNPLTHAYINSLNEKYEIIVSCKDYEDVNISYRNTSLIPGGEEIFSKSKYIKKIFELDRFIRIKEGKGIHLKYLLQYLRRNIFQLFNKNIFNKKIKCILAVDGDTLLAARLLSLILGVPYIYVVYEIWPEQFAHDSLDKKKTQIFLEKRYLKKARCSIVVNKRIADLLKRRYSLKNKFELMSVIPQFNNFEVTKKISANTPLKIHYHGGFVKGRGLEEVVKAMIYTQGAELYIRGKGNEAILNDLKSIISENHLENKVKILEPVQMTELVEQALEYDVGVIVAKQDTSNGRMVIGFKYFEYSTSGLAIIAPSSLTLKSVNKENNNISFYEKTEAKVIAERIQYLVDNPREVVKLKNNSIKASQGKYNFEYQKEQLLKIIEEVKK